MDTLCIQEPVFINTSHSKAVRHSFKPSSERALCTLVLDSDIQLLNHGFTYDEAFMRICYSSWSSRMWTLQEAVLSPAIVLQYGNGVTTFEEIMHIHDQGHTKLNLPTKQFTWYNKLREYRSKVYSSSLPPSANHLAMLQEVLKDRKTRDDKDKPMILANLIGIDLSSLQII